MPEDTRRIKHVATGLSKSANSDTVTKAAELLKLISEIENQRAQTRKLEDEVTDSTQKKKIKDLKEFVALLAPLVTTLVLAGTLALQSYQFSRTERDKAIDAQRQREAALEEAKRQANAAEDANWSDALKLLTGSEKLSPAVVLLKRFANSPRYSGEARLTAERLLLLKTDDSEAFTSLFGSVFVPPKWSSLSDIVDIDRQLFQRTNPLLDKVWDEKTRTLNWSKTSPEDKKEYDNLNNELDYISEQLAVLLKGKRPPSQSLDFHAIALWDTDLQGADLSEADISGSNFANLNLKGANLSGITSFENLVFVGSGWWECSKISPQLCAYLEEKYPFNPDWIYANGRHFTKEEYQAALTRLRAVER